MSTTQQPGPGLRAKLLLALTSVTLCLLAFLAAELAARLFTNVALLGNSRDLFTANVWGESKGNTPNAVASSFGRTVYIDANGFRIAPPGEASGKNDVDDALLILGDSVAFGPGVAERETLAGRLRLRLPRTRVFNASVIGHTTADYRNVAERFVPAHPEIRRVFVLLCLNDVSKRSAQAIDAALDVEGPSREGPIRRINAMLRSRSKLYLWVKNVLTDPPKRYWLADSAPYADPAAPVESSLEPLGELAAALEARDVEFFVVISPYEFQLRAPSDDARRPQRRIAAFLESRGIETIDALPAFEAAGGSSRDYFLGGDPMHLSIAGHAVMAELIGRRLDRSD